MQYQFTLRPQNAQNGYQNWARTLSQVSQAAQSPQQSGITNLIATAGSAQSQFTIQAQNAPDALRQVSAICDLLSVEWHINEQVSPQEFVQALQQPATQSR